MTEQEEEHAAQCHGARSTCSDSGVFGQGRTIIQAPVIAGLSALVLAVLSPVPLPSGGLARRIKMPPRNRLSSTRV